MPSPHEQAVEAAARNLHDVIAALPEEERPGIWDLIWFIAPAWGEELDVTFPMAFGEN